MADGRKKLLDWLLSIAHHFNCSQETLYFAIDIFDRYLALPGINIKIHDIQLIGITCYFMATKVYMHFIYKYFFMIIKIFFFKKSILIFL